MASELARDPPVINREVGAGQAIYPGLRHRSPPGVDAGLGAGTTYCPIQGIGG